MIKQDTIDRVLDCCNIVEVVGEIVPLKPRGANMVACCPFHTERTPSFTIYPNTGTFKCFGCGEQGNTVGFLMKHENLTYPEAIKALAKRYNIDIEETVPSAKEQELFRTKEAMWIANDTLAKEYQRQLQINKTAKEYAYRRWGKEYCGLKGIGYFAKNAKQIDRG